MRLLPFDGVVRYFVTFRGYLGRRVYVVLALTTAAAITEGLGIALLLPLLGLVGMSGPGGGGGAGLSGLDRVVSKAVAIVGVQDSLAGILLFIGAIFAAKGALKFAEGGYRSVLQARLMRDVQGRLFDAYARMNYRYYSSRNAGHFVNVIVVQVMAMVLAFYSYQRFLGALVTVAAYFAFAFLISWPFATMATAAGLAIHVVLRRLASYVHHLSGRAAAEYGTLNHLLVQTMQAFKYLTATAQVGPFRTAVGQSIRRLSGYRRRRDVAQSFTDAIQEPLAVAVLVLIIVVQVAVLRQPVAPVLVGLILIYRAMGQLVIAQAHWQSMMQEVGGLELVETELDRLAQHRRESGDRVLEPLARAIELRNVSFAYDGSDALALDGVSLTIPVNRTVAVVGESGSGKSTLVDLLTLMLRPATGQLLIDGVPHEDVDLASWRPQIGYVCQDTVVFDDSIANNISLWRGEYSADAEVRRRVAQAAARAGALGFIEELAEGFETRVGDRGVRLSGGQRQRLFVARELFKNPRLLILDEATSALDSESELVIKESVDQLKGSTTVVIIAHRLSTIRNADFVYVLDRGRIVEQGTYDELLAARDGAFTRMVALQQL